MAGATPQRDVSGVDAIAAAEQPGAVGNGAGSAEVDGTLPPLLAGEGIDPAERTPRSFHLSRSLLERARAAAYWVAKLPEQAEPTNVSELVERALRSEVERLERLYNGGVPFPAVLGRMRTGPGASGVERIRRAQRARRRPADPLPGGSPMP